MDVYVVLCIVYIFKETTYFVTYSFDSELRLFIKEKTKMFRSHDSVSVAYCANTSR